MDESAFYLTVSAFVVQAERWYGKDGYDIPSIHLRPCLGLMTSPVEPVPGMCDAKCQALPNIHLFRTKPTKYTTRHLVPRIPVFCAAAGQPTLALLKLPYLTSSP